MIDRQPLDAVLLDAGGTLVRLDFEWMAETLRGMGVAMEPARLRRGEVAGRRAYDASKGHPPRAGEPLPPLGSSGDTQAYFGGMLSAAGVPPRRVEAMLERIMARQKSEGMWTRPMEGARRAIDGLAALGLRLAVVSNSDGRAEEHLRDCGVLEGVEFVIDSHQVGVEKPDPAIFRIALEKLDMPPDRALYVGDIRSVDEVGARAAGVHFVLIDPYADYAAPNASTIRGVHQLAAWVAGRYELPMGRRSGSLRS